MRVSVIRPIVAVACLIGLAGCETTSTGGNPLDRLASAAASPGSAAADGDTTASVTALPDPISATPPLKPELTGNDPNDDISIGKKYFQQGSYGLAERQFRKAVERHPRDAEAWVGLAASYDRLRRFELADRAYGQAVRILGHTPEILNNQGFSYMLRGDYRRARATLLTAKAKDPNNPNIASNLEMLEESSRKAKSIN
jgi:Flp pilus assembly protein TadD